MVSDARFSQSFVIIVEWLFLIKFCINLIFSMWIDEDVGDYIHNPDFLLFKCAIEKIRYYCFDYSKSPLPFSHPFTILPPLQCLEWPRSTAELCWWQARSECCLNREQLILFKSASCLYTTFILSREKQALWEGSFLCPIT